MVDQLVFDKLKKTMGGEMRFLISGSAKLSSQVTEWFYSAGISIVEGYGSTETTVSILNLPDKPRVRQHRARRPRHGGQHRRRR